LADLLAGSLHLILQTKEMPDDFACQMQEFLVLWADFVDRRQGSLASCHGVGMQMRPYMPPFWTEESQRIWRNLQALFDPKSLFGKEHFFPMEGKSLERI
jgi:FAD/FMN-containing dehydrogenase